LSTRSKQVAAAQVLLLARHTSEAQSPEARHPCPSAQGPHSGPPQSLAVSRPFFTSSLQVGAAHVPAEEQTPEAQSDD
jgi:hypothetical protein